jgi:DNA damage-binding protein 1
VAWERIDNQRYVLADDYGKLYLLMLMLDFEDQIVEWRIDVLGETPHASVLVYLDAGCIFLGSYQGDSQVIWITDGGNGGAGSVEVLQTFPNIGPILDFTIMDMGNRSGEGQTNEYSSGQARIVTGSGAWKDGSLRSVRSGVGMEELGMLAEMEHVTNMFSLKTNTSSDSVDTLLVSFINESRIFFFDEEGNVEELGDHKGLGLKEQTLLASNLPGALLLQITPSSVCITDMNSSLGSSEWKPQQGSITAVAATDHHAVVSVDGTKLIVLGLDNSLEIVSQRDFSADEQLACVTVSPSIPNVCVVGFWQRSTVSVLDLKSLKSLQSVQASDEAISVPRNLLVANLFEPPHPPTLLVAMADGNVVTFDLDPSTYKLSSKKSTILGTQQANFKALPRGNDLFSVFATCEHPSLIYASEGRIVYSAVTAEKAVCVCPFDAAAYPGAVAIASSEDLRVAIIDTERTTHVQTLAVNETVRRIAYSPSLKAFGLGTIKRTLKEGAEIVESHFKLADEVLFKELDTYMLNQEELVECVMRAELDDGTGNLAERFVVGTAYLDDSIAENMRGRILVFEIVEDRILKLITELSLKGACRCLAMVDGNIAAALVKTVVIYSFDYKTPSHPSLTKKATYRTATAPIDINVTGSLIAIADLMKSVSVIQYKRGSSGLADSLVEVARHYQTTWGTAVANVAPGTWIEADAEGNLLVLAKDEEGAMEEDKRKLRVVSEIGLGEMVNRIRGVDVVSAGDAAVVPRAFLGTVRPFLCVLFSLSSSSSY